MGIFLKLTERSNHFNNRINYWSDFIIFQENGKVGYLVVSFDYFDNSNCQISNKCIVIIKYITIFI